MDFLRLLSHRQHGIDPGEKEALSRNDSSHLKNTMKTVGITPAVFCQCAFF